MYQPQAIPKPNMASNSSPIKPISECFIRPKHDDQLEQSNQQLYYLSHAELTFLPSHYLQKGLLFTKPSNFNIHPFLDKLKASLALALDHFYPLAGRFVTAKLDDDDEEEEEEDSCWLYLDCTMGPGARFIHAVCLVATVVDVVGSGSDMNRIIRGFFELGEENIVNYDGHTRALISVQVTEINDGIFIGFTMNHSVVDGTTFWHFVDTFSEIFRIMDATNQEKLMISQVPIIKPIFADGYSGPIIKLPYTKLNEFIKQSRVVLDPTLSERIFHFSSSSIAKLKAKANNECCDVSLGQISSFQSLIAFVWRSITRARNLEPDLVTTCTFAADARTRFEPPLSSNHFGTLILPIQGSSKVGELLENELGQAAMVLKQAIMRVDKKLVCDRGKALLETILKTHFESNSSIVGGQTAIVIGGSVRFNIYGSEFGLGKAIAIRTGYSAKTDGKVTANPGCEGDGSVDLEISLSSQTMSALKQDQEFMSFVSKA